MLARGIAREATWHRIPWQARERAHRMQVQAIIEPTPGIARRIARLEDANGNLALCQAGRGRQSGWPRANDQHWMLRWSGYALSHGGDSPVLSSQSSGALALIRRLI